jgi:hypothetical protein
MLRPPPNTLKHQLTHRRRCRAALCGLPLKRGPGQAAATLSYTPEAAPAVGLVRCAGAHYPRGLRQALAPRRREGARTTACTSPRLPAAHTLPCPLVHTTCPQSPSLQWACTQAAYPGVPLLCAHVGKAAHNLNAAAAAQRACGPVRTCSPPLLCVATSLRPLVCCTIVRVSKVSSCNPPLLQRHHGLGRRCPVPVGQAPHAVLLHGFCTLACAAVSSGTCILSALLRALAHTEFVGALRRPMGRWHPGAGALVRCSKTRNVEHEAQDIANKNAPANVTRIAHRSAHASCTAWRGTTCTAAWLVCRCGAVPATMVQRACQRRRLRATACNPPGPACPAAVERA